MKIAREAILVLPGGANSWGALGWTISIVCQLTLIIAELQHGQVMLITWTLRKTCKLIGWLWKRIKTLCVKIEQWCNENDEDIESVGRDRFIRYGSDQKAISSSFDISSFVISRCHGVHVFQLGFFDIRIKHYQKPT